MTSKNLSFILHSRFTRHPFALASRRSTLPLCCRAELSRCIIARTAFYWLCVQSGLPHGGFAYVLDAQTCQQIGDTLVDCTAHSSLCCECAVPNIAASMAYSAFFSIFLRERKSGGAGGAFAQKKEIFSFFILYLAAFQLLNLLFGGKT